MLRAGVLFCALVLFLMQAAPAQAAAGCCCGTGASTCAASDGCTTTMQAPCTCSLQTPAASLGLTPSWGEALVAASSCCVALHRPGRVAPPSATRRPSTRSDRPRVRPPRVG